MLATAQRNASFRKYVQNQWQEKVSPNRYSAKNLRVTAREMSTNIKKIMRLVILGTIPIWVVFVAIVAYDQSGIVGLFLSLASVGWFTRAILAPILENYLITQIYQWSGRYETQKACSTIRFWYIRLALYIMPLLSEHYKKWMSHQVVMSSEARDAVRSNLGGFRQQQRDGEFDYNTFLSDLSFVYLTQRNVNVVTGKFSNPISLIRHDRKFIQKVRRTDRYYQIYINGVKREIPHLRNREEYEALRMHINLGVTSGWSPRKTGKDFSFFLNDIRKKNGSIPFILSELLSTEEFSRWQPCFVERYTCISCGNDTKIWTEADADIMKDGECRLCSNHDSLTGRDTIYRLGHHGTKSQMELRTYLSGLRLPNSRIRELLGDLH